LGASGKKHRIFWDFGQKPVPRGAKDEGGGYPPIEL